MFPLNGINISIPSPHGGQRITDCICAVQCGVLVGPWCGWCLSTSLAAARDGGFQWENMSCLQLVFNILVLLILVFAAMNAHCYVTLLLRFPAHVNWRNSSACYVTHIYGLCMVKCYSIHMEALEICNYYNICI